MAFTILDAGTFTSTGANVNIPVPSSMDMFETINVTQTIATDPNTVTRGLFFGPYFGAGASTQGRGLKTVKTTAMLESQFAAATGFYYYQTAPIVEAQASNAITNISKASDAVVTQTNSYSDNDIIRIYNTTNMEQIGGMLFEISSNNGSQYTLLGLDSSGFTNVASAGNTRRVSPFEAVEPQFMYVTSVSKATQAVVTLSVNPGRYYVVGNKVHFTVPASFGMTQLDQQTGTILSIDTANYTVTVDIDSSAYSTFAFPLDSLSPSARLFATMAPAGSRTQYNPVTLTQTGYEFVKTPFHTGQFTPFMTLVGGAQSPAGASMDIINWICYKFER